MVTTNDGESGVVEFTRPGNTIRICLTLKNGTQCSVWIYASKASAS